ncbi:hypothetical protein [Seonamhaeicola maritimus]|uniref:hypothetical protein n=1 Tax=Seonamhaeicola maritimus TaxID=2591822 RepID=UPI00249493E9|nr:hypothetical protein [Seonamhaeicola maritimus]
MLRLTEKVLFFFIIIFSFLNTQCEEDVIIDDLLCDFTTVIDETKYANLSSDNFTFVNAEIEGDCLSIEIGASGCDGSTWKFELIDSGDVAESSPEQRYLKLDFNNDELCDAYFESTFTFDLNPVKVQGSNKIILHLDGLDESLEYSY